MEDGEMGFGKGKFLEWDWGMGKWYNGVEGWDRCRVCRFQKSLSKK